MNKPTIHFDSFQLNFKGMLLLAVLPAVLFSPGCARITYQPEPLDKETIAENILSRSTSEPGFRNFAESYGYRISNWPPEHWDFTLLTLGALYFNPELQVARAEYELRSAELKTAGQRINPEINIPLEHHSDTSADNSPWLTGLFGDLVFERRAKRKARINRALALQEAARINLQVESWALRNRLLGRYIDYYIAVNTQSFMDREYELLGQSMLLLEQRHELGQVSRFEVSLTRLEMQQLALQLASQSARLDEALQALINTFGITRHGFAYKDFSFSIFDDITDRFTLSEPDTRALALQNHLVITKALSEYQAVEEELKFQIEKQYPDIRLSPGLIFDQGDKIWALGSSWLLPMFNNNDGPIAEALARRRIEQAEFMSLQTQLINDISRYRTRYLATIRALQESRRLITELEEQHRIMIYQYETGHSDKLETVRSELGLVRAKQTLFNITEQVIRAMQDLENVVQSPLYDDFSLESALGNLFEWHNSINSESQE